MILILVLASVVAAAAQDPHLQPDYCSDLQRVVKLATTNERFASIAGKPRQGDFVAASLSLAGWKECSLYGRGTYTCDSADLDSADDVETAQATIVQQIRECLGDAWSEAADRSSPGYVVLHAFGWPVSITLSWDQTPQQKHVVRLILFARRGEPQ